jgi:hypothetical protein
MANGINDEERKGTTRQLFWPSGGAVLTIYSSGNQVRVQEQA